MTFCATLFYDFQKHLYKRRRKHKRAVVAVVGAGLAAVVVAAIVGCWRGARGHRLHPATVATTTATATSATARLYLRLRLLRRLVAEGVVWLCCGVMKRGVLRCGVVWLGAVCGRRCQV